ncbi:MAG: YitT family protein [Clostridia bacterium]|nr:YitT family protein [Clostridia bacterium]
MAKLQTTKIYWWQILTLVFAGVINAVGVILFLYPANVLDGGISGLSILLAKLTNVNIAVFIFGINIPFFLLGWKKLGWKFVLCSVTAIAFYAIFSFVFQYVLKLDEKMFALLGNDIFLCAVFGGIVSGIGSGLTIKMNGAIDGVEVLAVLFAKKLSLSVGIFVMAYNVILFGAACFLLGDFVIGLYSIVSYAVGLKAVDFIVEGFDKAKGCIIITDKEKQIAKEISSRIGRSVTLLESKGYYSNKQKTMMYCVVNRFEIARLKTIVESIDSGAFVTINEISEIIGTRAKYITVETKKTVKRSKTASARKKTSSSATAKNPPNIIEILPLNEPNELSVKPSDNNENID